jgi:hypothetical protein
VSLLPEAPLRRPLMKSQREFAHLQILALLETHVGDADRSRKNEERTDKVSSKRSRLPTNKGNKAYQPIGVFHNIR